jgi:Xaa-Pro aminopeptidase
MKMANNWKELRYELDKSENFREIYNSPWYSDTVYEKFSDAEYQRRYALAREVMARDGFDAYIFTGGQNIYSMGGAVSWATGLFDDRGMCQYVVFPKEGEPMLVYPHPGCHIEAARKMVSIKDVRGSRGGQYAQVMVEKLTEVGAHEGRIGITSIDRNGPEYMGAKVYQDLVNLLPKATFEFLPNLLHELTRYKSAEEIAAMERAGELVVDALEALIATARPGVHEYELAAAGTHAIMKGNGRVHLMMIGSTSMRDPKMVFPNPLPSSRVLKEGDIILNEMVATYMGFSAKIGQPITIGSPTKEADRFYKQVVLEGYRALEAELVPGKTLDEISKAGSKFREQGAQSRPILIHGLDLITALPYIHTDQVRAQPGDEVVKPGNAYAIEITPINADGTFGMFLSRTYVMTEDGQRNIVHYPMDELAVVKV